MVKGRMKALMKTKPGPGAELVEVDIPDYGPDDVLVEVTATSICGTDAHIYNWDPWAESRIKPPLVFGHEFAGTIVAKGDNVASLGIGDFISAETHITCGECYQCRTGQEHICQNVAIIGVDVQGCFSQYVALPARNASKTHPSVHPAVASIQEPFGNAVHTVLAGDTVGKTVVVYGCGPIGLCAIPLAHAVGVSKVFAIDLNDYRLDLARKLGAERVIDAKSEDALAVLLDETDGEGVDIIYEMSGAPIAIQQGLKALKNGGLMSLLGLPTRPVEIDITDDVVFKGVTIQGISGRKMFDTWYKTTALLESGRVDIGPIITHEFALEDYEEAFELMTSGNSGKIVFYPNGEPV